MRGIIPTLAWACFVSLMASFSTGQTLPSTTPTDTTQPVALPPEIADALKHEAAALSPTITVVFDEHWDPPMNAKEYAEATGAKNFDRHVTFTRSEKVRLTWQSDSRYLVASREFFQRSDSDKTILRGNDRNSFDGTTFYLHGINPGEDHSITRTDFQNKSDGDYINMHYFSVIGLPLPSSAMALQKHMPLRSTILLLLEADDTRLMAVEPVTIDDRRLIRLKIERGPHSAFVDSNAELLTSPEGMEYFYLDPARAYAQVRRESFDARRNLIFQMDCSDFQTLIDRGIFLPRTVISKGYGFSADSLKF
jgi:hypothetical protein